MAKDINWKQVEADYRAGVLSNRAIASKFDISDTLISRRAKKFDWKKDLKPAIKQAANRKVLEETVKFVYQKSAQNKGEDAEKFAHAQEKVIERELSDEELIETNARVIAGVQIQHRKDVRSSRNITNILFAELQFSTENLDHIEDDIYVETTGDRTTQRRTAMLRAVSLQSRAAVIRDLSTALKNLVGIERDAYGMNDEGNKAPELNDQQLKSRLAYLIRKAGNNPLIGTDESQRKEDEVKVSVP